MFERVNEDIKSAMKEQNRPKLDALRMLKSRLIENKTSSSPQPENEVVIAHYKKVKESIESFPKGSEHYEKLCVELKFLEAYMPQPLTESEVSDLISKIAATQATPQMGSIMKELTPMIRGKFDGKKASEMVKSFVG